MKKTEHYKGHRWSTDETKTLMQMWAEESSVDAIAKAIGTSHAAVMKMVTKLRANGIPLARRTKGHVAGRRNALWTQSEVEYVVRRRHESATAEQIAMELGRSFYAVQAMILKLRQEGADVKMLGNGVRRLWDINALRALEIRSDANVVQINRLKRALGE